MKSNYGPWTICRTILNLFGPMLLLLIWLWQLNRIKMGHSVHQDTLDTPSFVSRDVKKQYANYNAWWFNDSLPKDISFKWGLAIGPDGIENMAVSRGTQDRITEIEFNPRFLIADRTVALTELHEMCHVKVWKKDENHTEVWENCMRDLAKQGAFDNIW